MSKFTLSINLDSADSVSDLAGIAEIFMPIGRRRIEPDCLVGLLTYLDLGIQTNASNLNEFDASKWLYIANRFLHFV